MAIHPQHILTFSGIGMFWGIDLVDGKNREPATKLARDLCMMLRTEEYGVLLSADGPYANIIKYKPPMYFNEEDLKFSVRAIDSALTRLTSSS